jgi:integrase
MELPAFWIRSEVHAILDALIPRPMAAVEQLDRLADHVVRDHLLMNLLWRTGVLPAELASLTADDLDMAARTLRVRTLKKRRAEAKDRDRFIHVKTDLMMEWAYYVSRFGIGSAEPLIDLTRAHIRTLIRNACTKAIAPPDSPLRGGSMLDDRATAKTFRHSFAANCATEGVRWDVLHAWLGNSAVESTLQWYRLKASDPQDAVERILQ